MRELTAVPVAAFPRERADACGPDFRAALADAKIQAIKTNSDSVLELNGLQLAVRRNGGSAFSTHTGEYGAEWYFLDPENRAPNNPGVTVDFRAFLLATGGLEAPQQHFDTCMTDFGIRYTEAQLRVSRVDFAVDILAPWFEPNREALVVPPGTHIQEYTDLETETHSIGAGFWPAGWCHRQPPTGDL